MTQVCDRGGRSQRLWELAPTIRGPVGLQLASGLTLDLITPKPTRSVHLLDQPLKGLYDLHTGTRTPTTTKSRSLNEADLDRTGLPDYDCWTGGFGPYQPVG